MGRTLISDFVADPAGNVVGGSGYEVYVYVPETTTARTCYLASTGADTLATPFTPNAGVDTTLTTQAAPADMSLVVASSSGFFVGNVVPIQSGANRTEVVIKAIPDATHLTLEAAVGGAFTYPVGSSVGGEEMTGHYQAYVDDTDNTDAVYKNTGTSKSAGRVRFNTKAPQNYQTVQDEGIDLTQRAKLNFVGDGVTASDDGVGLRTKVEIPPWMPNLIPNSDFSRRTKWMTFMPEVFADTNGYARGDAGTAPTVAGNTLTQGAVDNEEIWPASGLFWRDIRVSAQFKAVATGGVYRLRCHRTDASNYMVVDTDGAGNLRLRKFVSGVSTTLQSVAQALTLNNWYWLEIEAQGTTYIAKLYNSGAAAAAKSSATLLQTLSGTAADAVLAAGAIAISSDQANTAWGGLATGDGGVYVEGWGPESVTATLTGGGMAIGFNEAADSGPIGKQWCMEAYVPATSRSATLDVDLPDGSVPPSTGFAASYYTKQTGLGGSGAMCSLLVQEKNSAGAVQATTTMDDAAAATWARITSGGAFTTNAATRKATLRYSINRSGTRTGTTEFSLTQLEQGSAATAWRNAPEDLPVLRAKTTRIKGTAQLISSSTSFVEPDSRDLAIDLFVPWDAVLDIWIDATLLSGTGNGDQQFLDITVDGTTIGDATYGVFFFINGAASSEHVSMPVVSTKVAAGKHRIAFRWRVNVGTAQVQMRNDLIDQSLHVTATKGK